MQINLFNKEGNLISRLIHGKATLLKDVPTSVAHRQSWTMSTLAGMLVTDRWYTARGVVTTRLSGHVTHHIRSRLFYLLSEVGWSVMHSVVVLLWTTCVFSRRGHQHLHKISIHRSHVGGTCLSSVFEPSSKPTYSIVMHNYKPITVLPYVALGSWQPRVNSVTSSSSKLL